MSTSDDYCAKALECLEQADRTADAEASAEFTKIAMAYIRLAQLASQPGMGARDYDAFADSYRVQ